MKLLDLFRPKWKHSDWEVRCAAVKKLKDQAALAKVAKNDEAWKVRVTAAEKLADQILMADIAKNDQSSSVRLTAMERLVDMTVLTAIAKEDGHREIRLAAGARMNNLGVPRLPQETYAVLAKGRLDRSALPDDAFWDDVALRNTALDRLTDQALLADVAKEAVYVDPAIGAVEKLVDQQLLYSVAQCTSTDPQVRFDAAQKLADKRLAQSVYCDLAKGQAMGEDQPLWYLNLLWMLEDRALLFEISRSKEWDELFRSAASKRLYRLD